MTETQKISAAMDDICEIIDELQKLVIGLEGVENALCFHESQNDIRETVAKRKEATKIQIKAFEQAFYVLNKYKD